MLFLAGCFLFFSTADAVDCTTLEGYKVCPNNEKAGIVPCGRSCDNPNTKDNEYCPCTLCHLLVGIHRIIGWGFKILTFVAVASLVGAGIMYIVSAGNEKLMETAKTFAKHTLMGFAIVLAAWLIVNYTMILLSKKADLGIGVDKWNEFNCDTSSDLGKKESDNPDCIPLGNTCSTDPNSLSCCEGTCQLTPIVDDGGVTVMVYICKQ